MYIIGSLTDFSTFTLESKIIGVPLASAVVGLTLGFAWEWIQGVFIDSPLNIGDILRTIIGTLTGGILSLFFPDVLWIMLTFGVASFLLIVYDFTFIYLKSKK